MNQYTGLLRTKSEISLVTFFIFKDVQLTAYILDFFVISRTPFATSLLMSLSLNSTKRVYFFVVVASVEVLQKFGCRNDKAKQGKGVIDISKPNGRSIVVSQGITHCCLV